MSNEAFSKFGIRDGVDTANAIADLFKENMVSGLLLLPQERQSSYEKRIQDKKQSIISRFLNKHFTDNPLGGDDKENDAFKLYEGFGSWKKEVDSDDAPGKNRLPEEADIARSVHLRDLDDYAKAQVKFFTYKARTSFLGSMEKQLSYDSAEYWGKIWDVVSLAIKNSNEHRNL